MTLPCTLLTLERTVLNLINLISTHGFFQKSCKKKKKNCSVGERSKNNCLCELS